MSANLDKYVRLYVATEMLKTFLDFLERRNIVGVADDKLVNAAFKLADKMIDKNNADIDKLDKRDSDKT